MGISSNFHWHMWTSLCIRKEVDDALLYRYAFIKKELHRKKDLTPLLEFYSCADEEDLLSKLRKKSKKNLRMLEAVERWLGLTMEYKTSQRILSGQF